MFLPVFGTPSRLTRWMLNLASSVVETIDGHCAVIPALSIEALRETWQTNKVKGVVFYSDTPQRALVEFFQQFSFPMMLVMEHPATVAEYAAVSRNLDIQTALRFTTQSYCSLMPLLSSPTVRLITEDVHSQCVSEFVYDYLTFCKIRHTVSQREAIVGRVLANMPHDTTVKQSMEEYFPHVLPSPDGDNREAPDRRMLVDAIATQYEPIRRGLAPSEFYWPPAVFVRFGEVLSYLRGPVDLTGPARVLIGGHALSLTRGWWRACAIIDVLGNTSGNLLLGDVFAEDRQVCGITARLPEEGRFKFDMDFPCENPYYPIIFRIATLEGAIEGEIELKGLWLVRISAPYAEGAEVAPLIPSMRDD